MSGRSNGAADRRRDVITINLFADSRDRG